VGGVNTQYTPAFREALDPSRYRADGSLKGHGFLGDMANVAEPGKTSSELSIGVDPTEISPKTKPNTGEGYTDIPSMVPTLNQNELEYLLGTRPQDQIRNNPKLFAQIQDKAVDFARQREAENKPFFASTSESPVAKPRFKYKPTLASEEAIDAGLK